MIQLDLAGLLTTAAGEVFSAIGTAPEEIQVTGILLDLPAVFEYVPGPGGGLRVPGRLRVRPPSLYPARRSRRPGRLRLVFTPTEEAAP